MSVNKGKTDKDKDKHDFISNMIKIEVLSNELADQIEKKLEIRSQDKELLLQILIEQGQILQRL